MKSPISILLLLAVTLALAEPPEAIQRVTLDERVVVTVPVATNRVTTISFPGPIAAIDAVGVTADRQDARAVPTRAHQRLVVSCPSAHLARKAATNLNIRWNKRTYVFELVESDTPVLALNLEDSCDRRMSRSRLPQVTPTRLLALLDKAKAFPLLKQHQPEAVAQRGGSGRLATSRRSPISTITKSASRKCSGSTPRIHARLSRHAAKQVRTGDSLSARRASPSGLATVSITSPSAMRPGVLPPKSQSTVYFAITGTRRWRAQ
jgi:hypothetical protein